MACHLSPLQWRLQYCLLKKVKPYVLHLFWSNFITKYVLSSLFEQMQSYILSSNVQTMFCHVIITLACTAVIDFYLQLLFKQSQPFQ